MNLLIVGYGRMGKEIEQIALNRGHKIVATVDKMEGVGSHTEVTEELLNKSDAVIEFALPEGIDKNCELYAKCQTPVVIGTTGWDSKREEKRELFEKANATALWGSNFSIGAHIMFKLTEKAAKLINSVPDYDIMVTEYHHKFKKDSPSGTAITIAEKIINNCDRKTEIMPEKLDRQIEEQELHVASVRGGNIPGIHTVTMDSLADTVEITHNARNRGGFALGAVLASEWLKDKKGFFRVEDFIDQTL